MSGSAAFLQAVKARRSIYMLNNTLPITKQKVVDIVNHAILHCPSSYNSQSTRAVVLFGAEHHKVWAHAESVLKAIVPADAFAATAQKMAMFSAAAGTVLFFEDQDSVKSMQEAFPIYKDAFPMFSEHTAGIHHYVAWTALSEEGVGANLQHYSPLIDQGVRDMFNVPESWALRAQLVFGGIAAPAGEKTFRPLEERVKVFGLE